MKHLLIFLFLSTSCIAQAQKFKKNEFSIGNTGGYFFDHNGFEWSDWLDSYYFRNNGFPTADLSYTRWINKKWSLTFTYQDFSSWFYKNSRYLTPNDSVGTFIIDGSIRMRTFMRFSLSANYTHTLWKGFTIRYFAGFNSTGQGIIMAYEGVSRLPQRDAHRFSSITYNKLGIQTGISLRHPLFWLLYGEVSTQYVRMGAVYFDKSDSPTLKGRLDSNQLFFSYNIGVRF